MSSEREGEGERLAGFIAGGLHDSGVLGVTDIQRATAIAAEEINANARRYNLRLPAL